MNEQTNDGAGTRERTEQVYSCGCTFNVDGDEMDV